MVIKFPDIGRDEQCGVRLLFSHGKPPARQSHAATCRLREGHGSMHAAPGGYRWESNARSGRQRATVARSVLDAVDALREHPEVIVIRRVVPRGGPAFAAHWTLSSRGHNTNHQHRDGLENMLSVLLDCQETEFPS